MRNRATIEYTVAWIVPLLVWLRLFLLSLSSDERLLDFDAKRLFIESSLDLEWTDRFDIWATWAHPLGVIAQHAYLKALTSLTGVSAERAWTWLAYACLAITFLAIVFLWTSKRIAWGSGGNRVRGLAIVLTFVAISPAFSYVYASKDEDFVGVLLFLIAGILIAYLTRRIKLGLKSVLAAFSAVVVVTMWGIQYGLILTSSLLIASIMDHRWRSGPCERVRAQLLIIVGGTMSLAVVLHLGGIVRYVNYPEEFPSLLSTGYTYEQFSQYLATFALGAQTALTGVDTPLSVTPLFGLLWLGLVLLLVRLLLQAHIGYSLGFAGTVLLTSLVLPFAYEPSSLERWVPLTVAAVLFSREWIDRVADHTTNPRATQA